MVVALAPAKRNQRLASPKRELTRREELVAEALANGHTIQTLATKLARGNARKASSYRTLFRRWMRENEAFRDRVYANATADLGLEIPAINRALAGRAKRGRPDATKLVWAASRFHNERISHEHSGDIQINVSIPRPQTTVDQLGPGKDSEDYVDADVVEE